MCIVGNICWDFENNHVEDDRELPYDKIDKLESGIPRECVLVSYSNCKFYWKIHMIDLCYWIEVL